MKNILITGGAGFIGSNFVRYMLNNHTNYRIINLDALTYAGNPENVRDIWNNPNHIFIHADIRDKIAINEVFEKYNIDTVVNFAAETHVDRSIMDPYTFVSTNVLGTNVLLDAAMNSWKTEPLNKYCREYKIGVRFIQVSTDEVYGNLETREKFSESHPLQPNSPYSASKASADLLVRAYHKTYGLPVNITRCSNNYGPYQFPEKFIPLIIINCLENKELPIYGDGNQIRDWLHVNDHCSALDAVLHKGKVGEVYNIGGNSEMTNIEIARFIISRLDKPESLIKHVKDRPGHDRRYAIDNTKITSQLGWKPLYSLEQGLNETISWYLNNRAWIESVTSGSYREYYKKMYDETATALA